MDEIETEAAFWNAAGAAIKAGLPLEVYLGRQGWPEKDIAELKNSPEYQARLASLKISTMMAQGMDADQQEGGKPTSSEEENGGS